MKISLVLLACASLFLGCEEKSCHREEASHGSNSLEVASDDQCFEIKIDHLVVLNSAGGYVTDNRLVCLGHANRGFEMRLEVCDAGTDKSFSEVKDSDTKRYVTVESPPVPGAMSRFVYESEITIDGEYKEDSTNALIKVWCMPLPCGDQQMVASTNATLGLWWGR